MEPGVSVPVCQFNCLTKGFTPDREVSQSVPKCIFLVALV
jgi:hypothetical protein